MGFELGSIVGDYQFIDVLESSREETTYKVRNVPAQRFETLRVLNDFQTSDPIRFERFQREAKILARLNHPHIVSYCASAKLDGRFVLATELVEGSSLAERLEVGRVSLPDAVRIVWQTLEALECAHGEGIVHRDVSPANIFLSAEGDVKLSGFALARSTADPRLTQAGAAIGSAHYMSPEQVQANGELDCRADLYSLGAVFYELVAGRKPFSGHSQFDVMLAQVEQTPVPPSHWERHAGDELDRVILKALEKRREDRFASAAEFREALMGVHLGASGEAGENLEAALLRQKESRRREQESAEKRLQHQEQIAALASGIGAVPARPKINGPFRLMVVVAITALALCVFFWMNALR